MYINRVELAGYLVKKPEVRYLPSGTPVANARLGQTHRYQDSNQKWQEQTNWYSLSFYGELSKIALTYDKGDNLFLEGAIEQRQFTPKDGSQRTVTDIVVRHCHIIEAPRSGCEPASELEAAPRSEQSIQPSGAPQHDEPWPVSETA